MSETVISVENLSKRYFIGAKEELPKTKGEAIRSIIGAPFKYLSSRVKEPNPEEIFWALKDVSFEVKAGEVIGLIGRNGAGKSTLLKILSRITKPSSGCVKIRGRVGSLLEVGTGFHPELTGRENIYLNGTILGMTKKEIDKKFDEIVDFAEVEKFLDTPVKRYSSGMYVRLAFAVAAHLETEILVVDEVLAVGDSEFQKKCLGKMGDVATKEGRTVLFVSHNMAAITQLCGKGILLDYGEAKCFAKIERVIDYYINSERLEKGFINLEQYSNRKGNQQVYFKWAKTCKNYKIQKEFSIGDNLLIEFSLLVKHGIKNLKLAIQLKTSDGINLSNMIDIDSNFSAIPDEGTYIYSVCLRDIRFYPDVYRISFWAGSTNSIDVYDHLEDCLSFQVTNGGQLTMRHLPRSAGILFLTPEWRELYGVC